GDGAAWYRRTPAVAAGSLLLGLLVGAAFGRALGDANGTEGSATEQGADVPAADVAEVPGTETPTTTTAMRPSTTVTLASACLEAIRSTEQALGLLDQGLQSLRQLDLNDLNEVLNDMNEVRDGFRRRVEECLEAQAPALGGSTTTPDAGE
ncbi:MAG: hypothetical protein M3N11_08680, partial [Actinomycetota bacterium]|nr:hypothetical protein [Actinomycetota bacterium]